MAANSFVIWALGRVHIVGESLNSVFKCIGRLLNACKPPCLVLYRPTIAHFDEWTADTIELGIQTRCIIIL
jgi:hypothetical protein